MSPTLVGRRGEMARLSQALDDASDASGVVLIAGEAGAGKSRLVGELAAQAGRRGFRVCIGRCVDLGEQIWPLAPLREIVAGLVDELDAASLDEIVGGARAVLARLVPDLDERQVDGPPVASDQVCELAVGVFRRLARRGPLLLVIEDLHWADDTTRTLFSALARVGRIQPSLLVGTFRDDELHRRHPLRPVLAEVERHEACERVEVGPLDPEATAELIRVVDGGHLDPELMVAVHRRSAGNPFYVEELVAAAHQGVAGLPDTLRDTILARTAMLDDTSQHVLGVIAAAGATTPGVVADVCRLDLDDLRDVLDGLFKRALLVADGDEVRFRHELGREVFEDELLPGERARIHAELAASIERRRPDRLGAIARHWSAAHDAPRALAASVAAGRQALRVGAATEAEGHLDRALELWDTVDEAAGLAGIDHAALLLETAVAAQHARHVERAIALDLRAAGELVGVDPLREARAWLHLRDLYRFGDQWDECTAAVQRALRLIPKSPPSAILVEALADAAMDSTFAGRFADATRQAREAVEAAEAVDEPEALIRAHYTLWVTADAHGEHERALEIARTNVARCSAAIPAELTLMALNTLTRALHALGRYAESIPVAQRGVELARRSGLGGPLGGWLATYWLESLAALGRWRETERLAVGLRDLTDDTSEEPLLAASLGVVLIRQGRLEEARPLVEQARARWERTEWAEYLDFVVAPVIIFDAAEGRVDEAVTLVERQLERREGLAKGRSALIATGIALLADHAGSASGGRSGQSAFNAKATAARWLQRVDDLDRSGPPPSIVTRVDRDQARANFARLCGEPDEQRWSATVAAWVELDFPYEEAEARLHLAEALLAGTKGRSAAARAAAGDELTVAHSIAAGLPAPPLLARIEDLARRARVPLDRSTSTDGPGEGGESADDLGLTRRELDVLALVARGKSNGQIADELFISTKTASVHVSSILRKLGVTNRVEAAAIATRRNISTGSP